MDEPPRITKTQVREWNEAIKDWSDQTRPFDGYSPQHPAFLWKYCWEHLNTMRIPIFSAECFFEKAIKLAKEEHITDSKAFLQGFAQEIQRIEKGWEIGFGMVHRHLQSRVFHHELEKPYSPTQDTWKSVYDVYNDRTFSSFLELVRGITVGWRPDSTIQSEENYVPGSCHPSKHDLYNGCYGHDYVMNSMELPPDECVMLPGESSPERYVLFGLLNNQY